LEAEQKRTGVLWARPSQSQLFCGQEDTQLPLVLVARLKSGKRALLHRQPSFALRPDTELPETSEQALT
jgi:hypothetical protein